MAAPSAPLIPKPEPLDENPQIHSPSLHFSHLKVKLEAPDEPPLTNPFPPYPSPSQRPSASVQPAWEVALTSASNPPAQFHSTARHSLEEGSGQGSVVPACGAPAVHIEAGVSLQNDSTPREGPMGSHRSGGETTGRFGGLAGHNSQHQESNLPMGAENAEWLVREHLRMMSEKLVQLQNEVRGTKGQTEEERLEVERLLEQNQALLQQPLALGPGTGSKAGDGALVQWELGDLDEEEMELGAAENLGQPNGAACAARHVQEAPKEIGAIASGVTQAQCGSSGMAAGGGLGCVGKVPPAEGSSLAGGLCTPEKKGPGGPLEREPVSPAVEMDQAMRQTDQPSSRGSVSEDGLPNVGGCSLFAKRAASERLSSFAEKMSLQGEALNPQTPEKTATKMGGWTDEPTTPPPGPPSRSASEVLSRAGEGANANPGVNKPPGVNGAQTVSGLLFDGDVYSGLEDNDNGFDSEPEEAPLAEEENLAGIPRVIPLLFAESDEEEGGGPETKEAPSTEMTRAELRVLDESLQRKGVVKERVGKKVKGPGKKTKGKPKGQNAKGGALVRKEGPRAVEKGNRRTFGDATTEEQRAWKSYDRLFKKSFTRVMLPSHVGGGFWLGVPVATASRFMKRGQCAVTFESGGRKHTVIWLWRAPTRTPPDGKKTAKVKPDSRGFSGGWKGFALDHDLAMGDSVVFEKAGNCRFRVHLFRRSEFGGDAAAAAEAANKMAERLDVKGGSVSGGMGRKPTETAEKGEGKLATKVIAGATNIVDFSGHEMLGANKADSKKRPLSEVGGGLSDAKRSKMETGEHDDCPGHGMNGAEGERNADKEEAHWSLDEPLLEECVKRAGNEKESGPAEGIGGEREMQWFAERKEVGAEERAAKKRQQKLTETFPVVKKAKAGLLLEAPAKPEKEAERLPAGMGHATAVTTVSGGPKAFGGPDGRKRIKTTAKRGTSKSLVESKTKVARAEDKESAGKGPKGAESGSVPSTGAKKRKLEPLVKQESGGRKVVKTEKRKGGTAERRKSGAADEPAAEYEGGRLVHYVDGGHRYVEASEADKQRAEEAMERCESTHPTFRVKLSKSQTDKGFWLGGLTTFCRENDLAPYRITALADVRGRLWNARIDQHASALSGGWRGFALDHRLEVGDALVLALVLPYVFAVRIFRAGQGGAEDDCSDVGRAYEGHDVCKEERRLKCDEKKFLATILGLPGGLPSPGQQTKPPPPKPGLPAPRNSRKLQSPKTKPIGGLLGVGSERTSANGGPENAFSAGAVKEERAISVPVPSGPGGEKQAPPIIVRTPKACAQMLLAGGNGQSYSNPAKGEDTSEECNSSGASGKTEAPVNGPSGKAGALSKAGAFGEPRAFGEKESAKLEPSKYRHAHGEEASTRGEPFGQLVASGKAPVGKVAFGLERSGKAGGSTEEAYTKPGSDDNLQETSVKPVKQRKAGFKLEKVKRAAPKSNAELMWARLNAL